MKVRRAVAYAWASPNTLIGLAFALLAGCSGGRLQLHRGVVETHGGLVTWWLRHGVPLRGGALALTLGHVVLGVDANALHVTREHERVHVRQYERWGPLFLPAYAFASAIAYLRGQPPYHGNRFEREAYDQA
ncbi:MAG: hypothetical protein AAGE65_04905 [Planctomycetota bacterium]